MPIQIKGRRIPGRTEPMDVDAILVTLKVEWNCGRVDPIRIYGDMYDFEPGKDTPIDMRNKFQGNIDLSKWSQEELDALQLVRDRVELDIVGVRDEKEAKEKVNNGQG